MQNIIISNTCIGQGLIRAKNFLPYNNPFIAVLIPNDLDYIKLINNLNYYINCNPILGNPSKNSLFSIQNKNIYYQRKDIITPYPVIYLDDIEIHCLHDIDNKICLEKFIRRLSRFKDIINNNDPYKITIILSFSELINDHDDIDMVIKEYFKENTSNLNIVKYFMGPLRYNKGYPNYFNILEWENIDLKRDSSHVYDFNIQSRSIGFLLNVLNFN